MPNPNFRADQTQLQPGQCTWLRWDVDGINAIYFFDGVGEAGVGGHDARQVCPGATSTYRLRIITQQNTEEHYALTVNVASNAVVNFWADHASLSPGQCTTLRWRVENVNAVYLNTGAGDEGQIGQGERQVCPGATSTYYLRVIHRDGREDVRSVAVIVASPGAPPSERRP